MMGGGARPGGRFEDLIASWPHLVRPVDALLDERVRAGRSVLLVGDPGVGKTELSGRQLDASEDRGHHVVRVEGALDAADATLAAFRSALPPIDGIPRAHVLRWAREQLERDAAGRPLVLGVDDAHALDPASAALVQQLVTTGDATTVVTTRAGLPLPDAIRALQRGGVLAHVDVGPLAPEEVEELLGRALRGAVARGTVQALAEASAGNLLFLRELCAQGVESGALRPGGGVWTWRGPIVAGGGLRRLLVERIEALDDAARHAIELLALAGTLGIELCEALVGCDAIDRLERRRLVAVSSDARREEVRLAHALLGEVVRDGCADRSAELHARLADALEARGVRRRADLARVAEWRLAAGQPVQPAQLVAAAVEAAAGFDHQRAERLATAAVDAGGGPLASIALGSVWCDVGRFADAEHLWSELDLAPGDPMLVQLALVRAENLFFGLDRPGAAAALIEEAQAVATTDGQRAQITEQRAVLQLYGGHPQAALDTALPLLRSDVARHRRSAAMFVGPALAVGGRCTHAVHVLDLALCDHDPETGTAGGHQTTGILLGARYLALALAGRLREAADQAAAAHQLSVALGSHEGAALFGVAVGHASVLTGRVDEAVIALEEAASSLRVHDRNRYLPWCLGELAHARALAGDLEAAEAAIEEADQSRSPAFRIFDCLLELGRTRVLAGKGCHDRAAEVALLGGRWAAERGQLAFAAQLLHRAARSGRAMDVEEELRSLAAASDSQLVAALAHHAAGLARGDGGAVESAAAHLGQLGAPLLAGEAAADAATVHLDAGRPDRALACALAAQRFAEGCTGLATGWIDAGPAGRLLSPRELEVVALASAGRTSRDVAEELYVSLRTVENHLHRAYAKLGVAGRSELADALVLRSDRTEWAVAHDVSADPSYGPPQPDPQEVEWLQMS